MTQAGDVDPADWITIWQSELAALAVDRECHEQLALFAQAQSAAARDAAARCAGADAAPGPAPAGPASGAGRDRELDALRARVAELERAAAGR